jgi:hypothetical protein
VGLEVDLEAVGHEILFVSVQIAGLQAGCDADGWDIYHMAGRRIVRKKWVWFSARTMARQDEEHRMGSKKWIPLSGPMF